MISILQDFIHSYLFSLSLIILFCLRLSLLFFIDFISYNTISSLKENYMPSLLNHYFSKYFNISLFLYFVFFENFNFVFLDNIIIYIFVSYVCNFFFFFIFNIPFFYNIKSYIKEAFTFFLKHDNKLFFFSEKRTLSFLLNILKYIIIFYIIKKIHMYFCVYPEYEIFYSIWNRFFVDMFDFISSIVCSYPSESLLYFFLFLSFFYIYKRSGRWISYIIKKL